jgi:hypothetical protein
VGANWDWLLSEIQAKYGLSDQDFADLLNGLGGWRARPRLNKDHQLVWEGVLISRLDRSVRGWYVPCVVSYGDPGSAPILGEYARSVLRDRAARANSVLAVASALVRLPGRESLIELSDTIQLTPAERRDEARLAVGAAIVQGGAMAPEGQGDAKMYQRWTEYLSEAEKDDGLRDHARRLRDAIEFHKQKQDELQRQLEEFREKYRRE